MYLSSRNGIPKNRQRAILGISNDTKLNIDSALPAVMEDTALSSALKKQKKELEKRKNQLQKKIENMMKNPSRHDPIYKSLEKIFSSENEHVLTRDMKIRHKIKRLAWRRFMLGYPPRKGNDTSIGDAINWEWLVHVGNQLSGRFIIVSRDSDFGSEYRGSYFLNDALRNEFRDRVGKKSIMYTHKLSDALKEMEVKVTAAEEKSESAQLRRRRPAIDLGFGGFSSTSQIRELLDQTNEAQGLLDLLNSPTEQLRKVLEEQGTYTQALRDSMGGLEAGQSIRDILRQQFGADYDLS